MIFEEQFPSLKAITYEFKKCEGDKEIVYGGEWVSISALRAFCLDKQRVREAISKATLIKGVTELQEYADGSIGIIDLKILLRELGL